MTPQPWEIWRARWCREDGTPDKVRPVLVLGSLPVGFLCVKITSKAKPEHLPHVVLHEADESFHPTGLDQTSYLVLSDYQTLRPFDMMTRLGFLDDHYRAQADEAMRRGQG